MDTAEEVHEINRVAPADYCPPSKPPPPPAASQSLSAHGEKKDETVAWNTCSSPTPTSEDPTKHMTEVSLQHHLRHTQSQV